MINRIKTALIWLQQSSKACWQKYILGIAYTDVRLIVIGAQKSGTTSLYHYLASHPNIHVPHVKEINYFNSIGSNAPSREDYIKKFPIQYGRKRSIISVDISPSYLIDAKSVAQNIHTLLTPSIKIVAILRDPVARAMSSWFMYKKYHLNNPDWFIKSDWVRNSANAQTSITRRAHSFGQDFNADIQEEIEILKTGGRIEYPIVEYGLYKSQLEHYIEMFGQKNILILDSQTLKNSTQACLDKITALMNIEPHMLTEQQLVPRFVGDNKQPVEPSVLAMLDTYYQRHNKGLDDLLGRNFHWLKPS